MRTPASIARHPIHPMLVPIPIGLWIFSLVCAARPRRPAAAGAEKDRAHAHGDQSHGDRALRDQFLDAAAGAGESGKAGLAFRPLPSAY